MEHEKIFTGYSSDTSDDEETVSSSDDSDTSDDESASSTESDQAISSKEMLKQWQEIFKQYQEIREQWQEFKKHISFAMFRRNYLAHEITEKIIQINFVLYAIGLQVYNSGAVRKIYKENKKQYLPNNKVCFLGTEETRQKKIYDALVESLTPPIFSIYGYGNKLKPMVKQFVENNKSKINAYAKALATYPIKFFQIKRMAKRYELSGEMQELSEKLSDYLRKQKILAWSGSKLGKLNKTNLTTFLNKPYLLEECIRFVKKVADDGTVLGYANDLDGLSKYLDDLRDEGPDAGYIDAEHIIVKGELRPICAKIVELIESNSEKDESIESFITNNWDKLMPDVLEQLKEDAAKEKYDWFVNILKASAYDFDVWDLIKDVVALNVDEMFDFIAAHYTAEAISNRYVAAINKAEIYTNKRGRLEGGV